MIAEFSVTPMGKEHVAEDVAKAVKLVEESRLDYKVGPLGTCIEGSLDQVLNLIQRCHQTVRQSNRRVITRIVLDDRDAAHEIEHKIQAVEQQIGHTVRH